MLQQAIIYIALLGSLGILDRFYSVRIASSWDIVPLPAASALA